MIGIGDIVMYRLKVAFADTSMGEWMPATVLRKHENGSLNLFVMSDHFGENSSPIVRLHVTLGTDVGQWRHRG